MLDEEILKNLPKSYRLFYELCKKAKLELKERKNEKY